MAQIGRQQRVRALPDAQGNVDVHVIALKQFVETIFGIVVDGLSVAEALDAAQRQGATWGPDATEEDIVRAVYRSLAKCYKETYELLERNTGKTYADLYIVGGGAKNKPLNGFTREFTGKNVVALPIESTALGNLKIQMGER